MGRDGFEFYRVILIIFLRKNYSNCLNNNENKNSSRFRGVENCGSVPSHEAKAKCANMYSEAASIGSLAKGTSA